MRNLFFLSTIAILWVLNTTVLQAQKDKEPNKRAIKTFDEARENYQSLDFEAAISKLYKITSQYTSFGEAWQLLGYCYLESGNNKKAFDAFQSAYKIDSVKYSNLLPELANLSYLDGNYLRAKELIEVLESSPELLKKNEFLRRNVHYAFEQIQGVMDLPEIRMVSTDADSISQYFPALTIDGNQIVFTQQLTRQGSQRNPGQEDLYVAEFEEFTLSSIRPLSDIINTNLNEGTQSIRQDGGLVLFTACNYPDSKGGCDIYFSYKEGDTWTKAENIGYPVNSRYWESTPCLAPNGRTIYFSSNRPGGLGGMDIWRSDFRNGEGWSNPVNLGPDINTSMDDLAPFLHADGKSLFFASNGHVGMGRLDLFVSKIHPDMTFSEPRNLGYPINTSGNEFGIAIPGSSEYAVFASDRADEQRKLLYVSDLVDQIQPEVVGYLRGIVIDSLDGYGLTADLELTKLSGSGVQSVSSSKEGQFLIGLPLDDKYVLTARKRGYFYHSQLIDFDRFNWSEKDHLVIKLRSLRTGDHMILNQIYFEFDSAVLKPESEGELLEIYYLLNENPDLRIAVSGHTDSIGTEIYNEKLSLSRAHAIRESLIRKGDFGGRIDVFGYGSSIPIDSNQTEEGRSRNRRTEITIVK